MARPALSASRTLDVFDLLASFRGRGLTISDISRTLDINLASCHAVLSVLVERSYLTRDPARKTYTLGPAVAPLAQAARDSQPLLARGEAAAQELFDELGVPVVLTARAGEEIVSIASVAPPGGRNPLRPGQRVPLKPPLGVVFYAWSSEGEIDAWIRDLDIPHDPEFAVRQREALAVVRARGFHVTLATTARNRFAAFIGGLGSGAAPLEQRSEVTKLLAALDASPQPERFEPDASYEMMLIAAPIFDEQGRVAYAISLVLEGRRLTGAQVNDYADRLVRSCLNAMQH